MWLTKAALAVCLLAFGSTALAVSKADLESRIQQLERRLDSRSLISLMEQVSSLQREVQQLRGDIEVQTHSMESLQKHQRDLYLDIDRRLHSLEAGGVRAQPTTEVPGTSAVAPAPPLTPTGRSTATTTGSAASAALNPAEERKDYDRALEQLKEGRYTEASSAFQAFLEKHPGSNYADNAQYWLGEVYYVTREFQSALSEFGKVVDSYPDSTKIADAKLKIGYIQYELKDWTKARDALTQVVQAYPGTTSARLAQERLDRMKREGH
ncbi:MAG: tol-pal system protein YbgF [Pseudomonadota bacterium]|nr:tol-pal system protein YbgF [Pseudomonadota bacterium]